MYSPHTHIYVCYLRVILSIRTGQFLILFLLLHSYLNFSYFLLIKLIFFIPRTFRCRHYTFIQSSPLKKTKKNSCSHFLLVSIFLYILLYLIVFFLPKVFSHCMSFTALYIRILYADIRNSFSFTHVCTFASKNIIG